MPKIFFLDFDFIKNFKISMRGIFFWYLRNPKFFWILQIFFALFVQIFFSFFFPLLFLFKFFIFNKFSNKANFWTFFLIHIISSHFTCFKFIICLEFDFSPTFLLILAFYIYFRTITLYVAKRCRANVREDGGSSSDGLSQLCETTQLDVSQWVESTK